MTAQVPVQEAASGVIKAALSLHSLARRPSCPRLGSSEQLGVAELGIRGVCNNPRWQ